jgi:3-hydroxybutyryl-CoA dehydrogenase
MSVDFNRAGLVVGIVGAGMMGRGIAQIAALSGCRVVLHDAMPEAAATARQTLSETFDKLVGKGKLAADAGQAALAGLKVAESLDDLAGADVVIEAIVEKLDIKQELMRQLQAVVSENCVLASNTSSLSVTAIAAACARPERVAGFHFFNPVPLMKVVEVIDGVLTAPWVSDALDVLARRMGHRPVRAKDTPGFIVNHAGRGFGTEALRILGENVAAVADIDRVLKDAAGFRMGPFELLDLTGLDVSHPVMEAIYHQFYQEPRFRPSPLTAQRVAAGLLGRKSGRGFYTYDGTTMQVPPPPAVPSERPSSLWIEPSAAGAKLAARLSACGVTLEGGMPSAQALCVVAPLGSDCTSAALAQGLDPTRTVAVDCVFGLDSHFTVMANPATSAATLAQAHGLFGAQGQAVTMIKDSPGFIAQRVAAGLINIACEIAQAGIACPDDIDGAVTLGLGYPFGPLAWGDRLGTALVVEILTNIHAVTLDPRYRPSPWLRRRAQLGLSLLTAENS